jgi:hypothetical protein
MWALRYPADAATVPFWQDWRDARFVAPLSVVALGIGAFGDVPPSVAAVTGVAALHGGLIVAALVWSGISLREASVVVALIVLARIAAAVDPMGALAYLLTPCWLARLAVQGRLRRLGLAAPWPWGAMVIGGLAGVALAVHLITCASRTLGYVVRYDAAVLLPALAYDLGANVLSAELFFRGALLQHLWRRWAFEVALVAAAGAAAVRYCFDPFVAAPELRVGAAVYMVLLALLNGGLYRWSGSLLPGIVAATVFFACYRLLGST